MPLTLTEDDGDAILRDIIATEARIPFDLVNGPLARATLVRLSADRHAFVFTSE